MNTVIIDVLTNQEMRDAEKIEAVLTQEASAGVPWWSKQPE